MTRTLLALLLASFCTSCAMRERSITASSIHVDHTSMALKVLAAIPLESAMESFEIMGREGHQIFYVALTDTSYGGLLFLDNKFYGTISRRDARILYSCRGYISATRYYWARDALDWADSLIMAAMPVTSVTLNFSGKSAVQSIKEVASNPILSAVKSLVGMGTNPLSIFSTLNTTRSNMEERKEYEDTLQALNDLTPGDSEDKLAKIVRPEDMTFTSDGVVMSYPSFLQDFYINDGVVKVRQRPSFYQLSRLHAAVFYLPSLQWDLCRPQSWRQAMPPDWNGTEAEKNTRASKMPKQ